MAVSKYFNVSGSAVQFCLYLEKGELCPSVTLLHPSRKSMTMDHYEVEDLSQELWSAVEEAEQGEYPWYASTVDLNSHQLKIVLLDRTKCELSYKKK